MKEKAIFFSQQICSWFEKNKRNFSFREKREPYFVWISEIMLQQTRLGSVINPVEDKFKKFIERFPNVQTLANANEEEVLYYWSGLGYYNRAKNLLKAAKIISQRKNCQFPDTYQELIQLPGIGNYTASAILSLCFDKPYAVFDGNVKRVITRFFFHDVKSKLKDLPQIAQTLLEISMSKPSLYNEAIMEFGSSVCIPHYPKCNLCFLQKDCDAFSHSLKEVDKFLEKKKKEKENLYLNVYLLTRNNSILLKKNHQNFLKGHYFFPYEIIKENSFQIRENTAQYIGSIKHNIMHYQIYCSIFHVREYRIDIDDGIWVPISEKEKYLINNLSKKIIKKLNESKEKFLFS